MHSRLSDFKNDIENGQELIKSTVDLYFSNNKARSLYGWMDLIISGLLYFLILEKPVIKEHVKHEAISVSTFSRYLPHLTALVEKKWP